MRSALLFPGQGSQYPDMLDFVTREPAAQELVRDLWEVLGLTPGDLHSMEALARARNIQLALFMAGVASFRVLEAGGARADLVAGFSIGAYSAAVASGACSFRDLLPVVALRAELMEVAYPAGYGMLAVVCVQAGELVRWVAANERLHGQVYAANRNSATQVVFAGKTTCLEEVAIRARALSASRVQYLDVPTPSHCTLLDGVAARLQMALAKVPVEQPLRPYFSNTLTRIVNDPASIREDLALNVARPIDWSSGTELMLENGVVCFVEALPSVVLTRLGEQEDHTHRGRWVSMREKGFGYALKSLAEAQRA